MAERPGLDLLDRALQQGWVTLVSLSAQIARHIGQHGVPKVRRLVRLVSGGERSAAERVFTGLLQRAGPTGWQVNAPICDRGGLIALGDVVFEAEQVVIEVDGWPITAPPSGSNVIAAVRTGSCGRAGPCCASPGATSPNGP